MSTKGGQGKAKQKPKPGANVTKKAVTNHKAKQPQKPSQPKAPKNAGLGNKYAKYMPQAKQLVTDTVKPELQTLRNDRQYINRQANNAIGDLESLYRRGVGDVNAVFGVAGQNIGAMGQQINNTFDQTKSQVGATDQQAVQQIQSNTNAQAQAVQAELARLGISTGGDTAGMQADGQFQSNIASQTGANNQANLGMQQASANTMSQMLGGMIQASKSSNLGQLLNSKIAGIGDINNQRRDDQATVTEAIAELKSGRPGMIRDMLMKLQAQGFDQWQAAQALNLDKQQLSHAMNMDRAGMIEDSSYAGTGAAIWGATANAPVGSRGSSGSKVPSSNSWKDVGGGPKNGSSKSTSKSVKKRVEEIQKPRRPFW